MPPPAPHCDPGGVHPAVISLRTSSWYRPFGARHAFSAFPFANGLTNSGINRAIRGRAIAPEYCAFSSSFDGNPLSIVFWNSWLWVMNRNLQIALYPPGLGWVQNGTVIDGSPAAAVASWLPYAPNSPCTVVDDPSFVGNLGSSGYQYFCTFNNDYVDSSGVLHQEMSAAGPVSAEVSPVDGMITLTNLPTPVTSHGFGTVLNVYRQGGTLPGPRRLPPIGTNEATGQPLNYTDTNSDAAILGNGSPVSPVSNSPSAPGSAPTLTPGPQTTPGGSSMAGNTCGTSWSTTCTSP